MKSKKKILLEDNEQVLIGMFADLISDICIENREECPASCYFKPFCPHANLDVIDSFCNLWEENRHLEVRKEI